MVQEKVIEGMQDGSIAPNANMQNDSSLNNVAGLLMTKNAKGKKQKEEAPRTHIN